MIQVLCYDIVSPGKLPRGTNGFFNYGKVAFVWTNFGSDPVMGATHWLEHEHGILVPEYPTPYAFVASMKVGVKVNWRPFGPPINVEQDIQVGAFIGNLLKATPALIKSLPGPGVAVPLIGAAL